MFFRVSNIQKEIIQNENEPKKKPVQIQDKRKTSFSDTQKAKVMDRQDIDRRSDIFFAFAAPQVTEIRDRISHLQ